MEGSVPGYVPPDVIISHAGEQKHDVADAINTNLGRRLPELNVFLDQDKLQGGDLAMPTIGAACRGASIGVVVLSKEYVRKKNCMAELRILLERTKAEESQASSTLQGVKLIPVLYKLTVSDVRRMRQLYETEPWYEKETMPDAPVLDVWANDLKEMSKYTMIKQEEYVKLSTLGVMVAERVGTLLREIRLEALPTYTNDGFFSYHPDGGLIDGKPEFDTHRRLTRLEASCGFVIDGLRITYGDSKAGTHATQQIGALAPTPERFEVGDQHIVRVDGTRSPEGALQSLVFYTSDGRWYVFGGVQQKGHDHKPFSITAPEVDGEVWALGWVSGKKGQLGRLWLGSGLYVGELHLGWVRVAVTATANVPALTGYEKQVKPFQQGGFLGKMGNVGQFDDSHVYLEYGRLGSVKMWGGDDTNRLELGYGPWGRRKKVLHGGEGGAVSAPGDVWEDHIVQVDVGVDIHSRVLRSVKFITVAGKVYTAGGDADYIKTYVVTERAPTRAHRLGFLRGLEGMGEWDRVGSLQPVWVELH